MSIRQKTALALFLAAIAAVAIYHAGLRGAFFFDDIPNLLATDIIRMSELSWELTRYASTGGYSSPCGRPVAQLSFALNHYFHGLSPYAFKLTNLLIHLVCAGLVFTLALRLFSSLPTTTPATSAHFAATLLAAIWLLHPIQALPVLHVVQRMTSLSALFLLAALILHIDGRLKGHVSRILLAWLVFWPLSVLSKETGILFPCFALAWELIICRETRGQLDRFARISTLLAGIVMIGIVLYAISPAGQWILAGYQLRDFTLIERLLTEGRVLWFYIGLILLPRPEAFGLYHDDIALSTGLFSPWTTLPALLGLIALGVTAWKTRKRAPVVSFGIAWFLIGHALESSFIPLEIAHEHRNYLPLFGLLVPPLGLASNLIQRGEIWRIFSVAFSIAALSYLALLTGLRANQYSEEILRTQIESQHHRLSARAQFDAGRALAGLDDSASANAPSYSFARKHYELSAELDANSKMPWLALIRLNCKAGLPIEENWIKSLEQRLWSTPFAPGDQSGLYALKNIAIDEAACLSRTEIDRIFRAALSNPRIMPGTQATLHSWHADYLWLNQKDLQGAMTALKHSLDRAPENPSNRLKWAQLIFISGDIAQARKLLLALRFVQLSPAEKIILEDLLGRTDIAER